LNAIILAAGKGERLRPLTENKPKCLVSLFGKTLLEWQIESFHNQGIDDITIVTGYKSDLIKYPELKKIQNKNYDSTNMVETLFCAQSELKESTIVCYGDILFNEEILKKLVDNTDDFSVIVDENWYDLWKLRFKNPLDDAESLQFDNNLFLQSIGQPVKKIDEIQSQYIGLMKFQNEGILKLKSSYQKAKEISKKQSNPLNHKITFEKSYMTDLLNYLIKNGSKIKAIKINGGWLELDSMDDYELYENLKMKDETKKFFH
jgi:L-glutamine-phosphate cytidylyltransferase|tara:strand:+ start:9020 stop:9802 length:783 start_codon:yes stop_codon:yes gene_type:complete